MQKSRPKKHDHTPYLPSFLLVPPLNQEEIKDESKEFEFVDLEKQISPLPLWTGNDPNHPYNNISNSFELPNAVYKRSFSSFVKLSSYEQVIWFRYTYSDNSIKFYELDLMGSDTEEHSVKIVCNYCYGIRENATTHEKTKFFCLFEKQIRSNGTTHGSTQTEAHIFQNAAREHCGDFSVLHQDLIFDLLSFLDVVGFGRLMRTNRYLYEICNQEKSYQIQCQTMLGWNPVTEIPSDFASWKSFFIHLVGYEYFRIIGVLSEDGAWFDRLVIDIFQKQERNLTGITLPRTEHEPLNEQRQQIRQKKVQLVQEIEKADSYLKNSKNKIKQQRFGGKID